MANAQLLMYGSKHLEQNFFLFCFSKQTTTTWDCWVPHSTQLFLWKINTNFKIKSAAKPEHHQNQNFHQAAQCTTDVGEAGLLSIHYSEISGRRIASHCILGVFGSILLGIIILLIAHSLKRQAVTHHHACIIMHQHHASWVMPGTQEFLYVSAVLGSKSDQWSLNRVYSIYKK